MSFLRKRGWRRWLACVGMSMLLASLLAGALLPHKVRADDPEPVGIGLPWDEPSPFQPELLFLPQIPGSGPPPPALPANGVLLATHPRVARTVELLAGGDTRVVYQVYNNLARDLDEFSLRHDAAAAYGTVTPLNISADSGGIFEATQSKTDETVTCLFAIKKGLALPSGQTVELACRYREADGALLFPSETLDPLTSSADANYNQVHDLLEATIAQSGSQRVEVLVLLAAPIAQADRQQFASFGGTITEELPIIDGFQGEIPADQIFPYRDAAKPDFIEADPIETLELSASTRAVRADRVWLGDTDGYANPYTGTLHIIDGDPLTTIALVDTGLDDSHPSLGAYQDVVALAGGWAALAAATKIVGWYSTSAAVADTKGHGSHVAGIAAGDGGGGDGGADLRGIAHDARLMGLNRPAIASLNWLRTRLANYHVVAVNQSLGSMAASPAWDRATRRIVEAGVVAVKSAGNSFHTTAVGLSSITTPGNEPKVLTVGAVNPADRIAYFSSTSAAGGVKPDVVAPGVAINSVDSNDVNATAGANNYKTESGTSMAAPHVAGEVALIVDAMTDYDDKNSDGDARTDEDDWDGVDDDKDDIIDEDPGEWPYTHNAALMAKALVLLSTFEVDGGERVPCVLWYDEDNDNNIDNSDEYYLDLNCNQRLDAGEPNWGGLGANGVQDVAINDIFSDVDGDNRRSPLRFARSGRFNAPGDNGAGAGTANDGITDQYHRGSKDATEGYGRIAVDAALEAVTHEFCGYETDTLGGGVTDKKVWARHLHLYKEKEYQVRLDVPAGADYDVYLYQEPYMAMGGGALGAATGNPVLARRTPDNSAIEAKRVATGGTEEMRFKVPRDGLYFLVVRRVSGSGQFTIRLITPGEWTVMAYMPAELLPTKTITAGLDALVEEALNDMEETGSGQESMKEFQMLALVDYDEHAWDGQVGKDGGPDHRGDAVLYCIRKDHATDKHQYSIALQPDEVLDLVNANQATQRAEADMGDPETLRKFATWSIDHFPAKKYTLILWGDGTGYGWKVNPDQALGPGNDTKRTPNEKADVRLDALEMRELSSGLALVKTKIISGSTYLPGTGVNRNLDLLGFDMGHMALIDVAYQVQESVDVYVASEERVHDRGWPYKEFLAGLNCSRQGANWNCDTVRNRDADSLGVHAVDVYHAYYEDAKHKDDRHTLSALRITPKADDTFVNPCDGFSALIGCVNSLAAKLEAGVEDLLTHNNPTDNVQIKIKHEAREKSEQMSDKNYIDLRHFARNVRDSSIPTAYKDPHAADIYAALELKRTIVLANGHGSQHLESHGMTIYFPHDQLLPEEACKDRPEKGKDHACGFDNPLPSPQLYAKDEKIKVPMLKRPAAEPTHPRVQIPELRFPEMIGWDEFLHRYYKPVADACILFSGDCVESLVIFVGETVTLSGAGSSDSDGPAQDDIPQHWYWDVVPLIDTGGMIPTYPLTSSVPIDVPCSEDCDRDNVDEADDDADTDAETFDFTCPFPGEFSFRLMTHDEHNDQGKQHGEETHYVHWKVDDDSVSLVCIHGKYVPLESVIPGESIPYAITIPAQPGLTGPVSASFSDQLPETVEYVAGSCEAAGCVYDADNHSVNWTGQVSPQQSVTVDFEARVPVETIPLTWPPIRNEVIVNDGLFTHVAVTETPVQCVPFKRASLATVAPGQTYQYTVVLPPPTDLTGPVAATIVDPLPEILWYATESLKCLPDVDEDECRYDEATHAIIWKGSLVPEEQVVLTYSVQVTGVSECPPQIINEAHVTIGLAGHTVSSSVALVCRPPGE